MSSDEDVSAMEIHTNMSKDRLRRLTKPLMEKRRRARINSCLNQLKNLVLEAMNQNTSHFSKLEKADILEMTVKHLCQLQRRQAESQKQLEGCGVARFRAGYTECAQEVARCLATVDNDTTMTLRVMQHLSTRIQLPVPFDSQHPTTLYPYKSFLRQSSPRSTMYVPVISPTTSSPQSAVFPRFQTANTRDSAKLQTGNRDVKPVLNSVNGDMKSVIRIGNWDTKPVLNIANGDVKRVLNTDNLDTTQSFPKLPVKSEVKSGLYDISRNVNNRETSFLTSAMPAELTSSREREERSMPSGDEDNEADDVWRPW